MIRWRSAPPQVSDRAPEPGAAVPGPVPPVAPRVPEEEHGNKCCPFSKCLIGKNKKALQYPSSAAADGPEPPPRAPLEPAQTRARARAHTRFKRSELPPPSLERSPRRYKRESYCLKKGFLQIFDKGAPPFLSNFIPNTISVKVHLSAVSLPRKQLSIKNSA